MTTTERLALFSTLVLFCIAGAAANDVAVADVALWVASAVSGYGFGSALVCHRGGQGR